MNFFVELVRHPVLATRLVTRRIKEIPSRGLPRPRKRDDDDFDQTYGVETSKSVPLVPTKSPNFSHGRRYGASPETAIRWCIENCGMPLEETTFVDVGSGKGRVLIVAAMYPFKRIIGIEYSPQLVAICRQNLQKLSLTHKCEVIAGDAADFKFPDGNLLAYLYNPFDSVVLERVLKNLAATNGHVRIAQLGPGNDLIQASGIARPICSVKERPTVYEVIGALAKEEHGTGQV